VTLSTQVKKRKTIKTNPKLNHKDDVLNEKIKQDRLFVSAVNLKISPPTGRKNR
jgi:hypothetical protein